MSGVWTEELDALLKHRRGEMKLAWKFVAPIGPFGVRKCQTRWVFLTSDQPKPVVRQSVKVDLECDRDGLDWLRRKGRLTAIQAMEGFRYRDAFRYAGDVSLKSALDIGVGGGAFGSASPNPIVSLTSAKRELFVARYQVLRGQTDMLTVMDGVCGVGHTLRALAGGDKHRARDLEAILKVALDLLVAFRSEPREGA